MAILNPEHLLQQAELLIQPPRAGPRRQVDIRRAISAAYYAVFHAIVSRAADQFVGAMHRNTAEYGLVSRSIDHATIRRICEELARSPVTIKYSPYVPRGGFDISVTAFAAVFPNLQEKRHAADYDPLRRFVTKDAESIIATARSVIARLDAAPTADRKTFLFLLLFPPRR